MKKCSICQETKEETEFKSDNTYCVPCKRVYDKEWYVANRDKRLLQQKIRRDALDSRIRKIKESSPCTDCGVFYPYCCMDFDHLEGSDKVDGVAHLHTSKWEVIEREIAKCELVCANCHRIRTRDRHPFKRNIN